MQTKIMNNTPWLLSRRNFIKTTGLALSAAATPAAGPLLAAERKKWPVGCRDLYLKLPGKPDCWSAIKSLGADGTEVLVELDLACPNLFHPEHKYTLATADGIRAIKDDMAASGCRITAFIMSNRFDERLEQELQAARGLVQAAQQLGVDAVRIDVVPRKLKADQFLPFAIDACKRLCATAQDTPVRFGVENHGSTTNNPQFLDKLFDGVGSDKLGLTLDCANLYWWGMPLKDLYGVYEKFAPRVVHTHCKSIHYPADKQNVRRPIGWEYDKYDCPIYEGDLDFKRIVSILGQANYRGDLCVEDESLGKYPQNERADIIRKEIAFLKELA
jgi:sugar phosphate isomerase/epimerase